MTIYEVTLTSQYVSVLSFICDGSIAGVRAFLEDKGIINDDADYFIAAFNEALDKGISTQRSGNDKYTAAVTATKLWC